MSKITIETNFQNYDYQLAILAIVELFEKIENSEINDDPDNYINEDFDGEFWSHDLPVALQRIFSGLEYCLTSVELPPSDLSFVFYKSVWGKAADYGILKMKDLLNAVEQSEKVRLSSDE